MLQEIIVTIIILGAVIYGTRIFLRKRRGFKADCGEDCDCHK